jgi:hypothetical protein
MINTTPSHVVLLVSVIRQVLHVRLELLQQHKAESDESFRFNVT